MSVVERACNSQWVSLLGNRIPERPQDRVLTMKKIFSIILLLLGSSWFSAPGASLHAQSGIVHTYSATPTSRAKTHPYDERRDSQRKQKKDAPYKRSVHRQHIRVRHNPLETACCCKVPSGVRIGLIAFHFTHVASLSAGYIPSLVRKRGPPGG